MHTRLRERQRLAMMLLARQTAKVLVSTIVAVRSIVIMFGLTIPPSPLRVHSTNLPHIATGFRAS